MEKLIKEKQAMKAKKPNFVRADAHKKTRLGSGWRRPKGLQNKMRLGKKGYRVNVRTGYKTPAVLQDTKMGLEIVRVYNLAELEALDPKKQAAEIAKVGRKNKTELIEAAKKKNITLVNLPVDKYQEKSKALAEEREAKKKALAQKAAAKEKETQKKEAEAAKKEAEEKKAAEEKTEEEVKAAEKAEKDKVLTSKKGY